MKRRTFIQNASIGLATLQLSPSTLLGRSTGKNSIRLGGAVFEDFSDPEEWVSILNKLGYRAAYCPVSPGADRMLITSYKKAAKKFDIVISEVGAWSNPLSPDAAEAAAAHEKCIKALNLADEIGANCCVNISGSRNPDHWAGPHKDNLSSEVFDMVVESTRKIIDAVKPTQSYFALEAMPWSFPDSAESYLALLKAIDRKRFAVHLDPVNMISSVRSYYGNAALIKDMFSKLGPHIRSCHAKDITLREDNYIPQLDEVRAGLGTLDYGVFLSELSKLNNVPLMMEHLNTADEYKLAADYIRKVGKSAGLEL